MDGLRILVANEPRAYRETIAAALRCLRPLAEVVVGEPRWLDREVARVRPHLLLSSDPAGVEGAEVRSWVLLYPGGTSRIVVCIDGEQEIAVDLSFDDLLAVVDRAGKAAQVG